MALALTRALIAAELAKARGGQRVELIDSVEPGLRLRTIDGGAQWSFMVRLPGVERLRVPLGPWPVITLTAARASARGLRRQIDEGEFQDEKSYTVAMLTQSYATLELKQLKSGQSRSRSLNILFKDILSREASSITRRDLTTALETVAITAPVHANRMLAYARAMFAWAVRRGRLDLNPALGMGKPTREKSRERTPSLDELVCIWCAAGKMEYPFGHAIQLLMVTAARRSEIANLKVDELRIGENESEPCWVLPASRSKNARSIRSPLSPLALRVLADTMRFKPDGADFLFSTNGKTPISGWSKAKARLDSFTGLLASGAVVQPWRLHDLRRSFATLACDVLHIEAAVADRCLNHVGASTTSTVARVYARGEMFDQRKAALEEWSALIESAINEKLTPAQ